MNHFGLLSAEDIECRVQQISAKGLSLLLYKNARIDAAKLDAEVGPDKWQCKFYQCKDTLFCSVGIKTALGEWIWKDDAGSPSNMEAQKGEASDAFKRACFKHGIGRELYTAPFIWITPDGANITANGQKYVCYDRFKVTDIAYDLDRICYLEIYNEKMKQIVYTWGNRNTDRISKKEALVITQTLEHEGIKPELVWELYKVRSATDLTTEQATNIKTHMDELKERYGK